MKHFILTIPIIDEDYADDLIISLVRQGYAPFFNPDGNAICFLINNEQLQEDDTEDESFNDFMKN